MYNQKNRNCIIDEILFIVIADHYQLIKEKARFISKIKEKCIEK
jgi:hypothetical protein